MLIITILAVNDQHQTSGQNKLSFLIVDFTPVVAELTKIASSTLSSTFLLIYLKEDEQTNKIKNKTKRSSIEQKGIDSI